MAGPTGTLLVTGGAGFIGSAFVRSALARGRRAVVLDALAAGGSRDNLPADGDGLPDGLPDGLAFVEGDVRDAALVADVFGRHGPDAVVHFAAESHVDRSIADPVGFVSTNVLGTQVLLDAARAAWAGRDPAAVRFHHVSTDEVYGDLGPDDPPFTERTPYAPSSPYSASKAGADHLVRAAARTYGLPVTLTNCSNNYGPRQHAEKLVPTVLRHAVAGRPVPVYGDGRNVRDWLHVDDHCDAVWTVLERGALGETYNVGARAEAGNLALVRALCDLVDDRLGGGPRRDLVSFVADRPGHDRRYAVDPSKLEALGWRPRRPLREGLAETVDWYLARPERLREAGAAS